jgi:hypothetical protein
VSQAWEEGHHGLQLAVCGGGGEAGRVERSFCMFWELQLELAEGNGNILAGPWSSGNRYAGMLLLERAQGDI